MKEETKYRLIWAAVLLVAIVVFVIWRIHVQAVANALDDNGCYTASNAIDHVGQDACVDFNVGYTYQSSAGNMFIDQYQDYSSGFEVYIPSSSAAAGTVNLSQYANQDIEVTGEITNYEGAPQITVTNSNQLTSSNN